MVLFGISDQDKTKNDSWVQDVILMFLWFCALITLWLKTLVCLAYSFCLVFFHYTLGTGLYKATP